MGMNINVYPGLSEPTSFTQGIGKQAKLKHAMSYFSFQVSLYLHRCTELAQLHFFPPQTQHCRKLALLHHAHDNQLWTGRIAEAFADLHCGWATVANLLHAQLDCCTG